MLNSGMEILSDFKMALGGFKSNWTQVEYSN